MAIQFITGLPRAGKTLWTLCHVRDLAEKDNRQVYTCNIPGITIPGWLEIDHPDKWMDLPDGCIILVDELQDFWQKAPTGARIAEPILELSKHGKRGIDFFFITQEPNLVHSTPRDLCQHHYYVVRAFGSHNAAVYKFERMQTHPEKVKSKGEKFPWRYKKEAFTWYKSADTHNVKRQIPLKLWAIPGGLVLAGLAVWAAFALFGGVLDRAKLAGKAPGASLSSSSPAAVARPPVQAAVPTVSGAPLTVSQYVGSFIPRIDGFPQSAPRYDDLNKAVQVPKPAACVSGRRPGAKVDSCKCYTQQATPLDVPDALCRQIAAGGYFDDTLQPSSASVAGQVVVSPAPAAVQSVQHSLLVLPGAGYGLRDPGTLVARNEAVKSIAGEKKPSVQAVNKQ
jgi:zona occludens toxin